MDEDRFFKMQLQMKNNHEDYRDFLEDIDSWSNEMKVKEKKLISQPPINNNTAPLRNGGILSKNSAASCPKKRIKAYDYAAWDKFDVDKALEAVDKQADMSDETAALSVDVKSLAEQYKDVGNIRFKEQKYEEAVKEYSSGIKFDSSNAVIYSNRAMAFMKLEKYEKAEDDCCVAVRLDPMMEKAHFRRAKCLYMLNRKKEAIEVFKTVLKLNPKNSEARTQLEELERELNTRGVVKPIFGRPLKGKESSKPLINITITDVDPLNTLPTGNVGSHQSKHIVQTSIKAEKPVISVPSTSVQLSRDLLKLYRDEDDLSVYVINIEKTVYKKLIGHALDSDMLMHLLNGLCFAVKLGKISHQDFADRLCCLSDVPRFNSSYIMLSNTEKQTISQTLAMLDESLLVKLSFLN